MLDALRHDRADPAPVATALRPEVAPLSLRVRVEAALVGVSTVVKVADADEAAVVRAAVELPEHPAHDLLHLAGRVRALVRDADRPTPARAWCSVAAGHRRSPSYS